MGAFIQKLFPLLIIYATSCCIIERDLSLLFCFQFQFRGVGFMLLLQCLAVTLSCPTIIGPHSLEWVLLFSNYYYYFISFLFIQISIYKFNL